MYPKEENGDMLLRPMTEADLAFMLEVRNEVRELIHDNRIFTLDECIEWFHRTNPENYVINAAGNDIGIMRVRRGKQSLQSAEIGGDIHEDYRRHGFGATRQ